MAGARAKKLFEEEAKERQKEAGERGGKTAGKGRPKGDRVPANLPEACSAGDARDLAGKAVGVSGKTVDVATKVLKAAPPDVVAAVDAPDGNCPHN